MTAPSKPVTERRRLDAERLMRNASEYIRQKEEDAFNAGFRLGTEAAGLEKTLDAIESCILEASTADAPKGTVWRSELREVFKRRLERLRSRAARRIQRSPPSSEGGGR